MEEPFGTCPAASSLSTLLTLVTTIINIQTPEDLASVSQIKDGDSFDFIIVGAGSAGCVLANRFVTGFNTFKYHVSYQYF